MKVKRYSLTGASTQQIEMTAKAKVIHVAIVQGKTSLWAIEDDEAPVIKRTFIMVTDSNWVQLTTKHKYVGTVIPASATLAFHIFEETA